MGRAFDNNKLEIDLFAILSELHWTFRKYCQFGQEHSPASEYALHCNSHEYHPCERSHLHACFDFADVN